MTQFKHLNQTRQRLCETQKAMWWAWWVCVVIGVPDPRSFTTASLPPSPPQEIAVSFDQATNKVYISWSEVQ